MNTQELRKLTIEELQDKIAESKKKLIDSDFNLRIGKEKDSAARKLLRREIARMLSIRNEKLLSEARGETEVK